MVARKNPFPGPRPYQRDQSEIFFGREKITREYGSTMFVQRCVTLYGPSGAGKSSLMQAGILPIAEDEGFRVVVIDTWPAEIPALKQIVAAVHEQLELGEAAAIDEPEQDLLADAMRRAWQRSERPILLYLDQTEQLLWRLGADEAAEFVHRIDQLLENAHDELHLVVGIREDWLGRWRAQVRGRRRLIENWLRLQPMTVSETATAVCNVAAKGDPPQSWDHDQIRDLLRQVRAPGEADSDNAEVQAAYAQIVCLALFDKGGLGKNENGFAEGILTEYLDDTLCGLGALNDVARELLEDELIERDGSRALLTAQGARAKLQEKTAEQSVDAILDALEKSAVLRATEHQGSRYFELGHDWLAKKVSEGRKRREETRQQEELDRERAARIKLEELEKLARHQRDAALQAQREAVRATLMAGARELLSNRKAGLAALVLDNIDNAAEVRGWTALALDILQMESPHSTRRHDVPVTNATWSREAATARADAGSC